jgi:nicotinamide mononucleotide transporter
MTNLLQSIYDGLMQTGWVEGVAVIAGIVSVWYSRKENILVYPTGLVNTIFYIYLSYKGHLLGEASVNLYYTVMSIYGWYLWTRKKKTIKHLCFKLHRAQKKSGSCNLHFLPLFIF